MKDKKGIEFLGGHVVNLIITVIIILLLVFVGLKIYGLFVNESSDLEQAKAQLIKVKDIVDQTYATRQSQVIETFFTPAKDWYIRSFYSLDSESLQDLPQGACRGQRGCLCICESFSCDGPHACIGAEYDIKFLNTLVIPELERVGTIRGDPIFDETGTKTLEVENLRLSNSVYQIRTSIDNEGVVVLRPVSR